MKGKVITLVRFICHRVQDIFKIDFAPGVDFPENQILISVCDITGSFGAEHFFIT